MRKIPGAVSCRALDSVAFMNSQYGVAFNGMITLNFEQAGVTSAKAACRVFTSLNEAIADKLKRYGAKWGGGEIPSHHFLYVHEHVETYGHHMHELIVLPRGLAPAFGDWLQGWARRTFGEGVDPKAIHYGGEYPTRFRKQAELQGRLVCYVLKSSADLCISALDGTGMRLHTVLEMEKPKRCYCMPMKRVVGTSQNIARRAQMEACYEYPNSLEDVLTDRHLLAHYVRREHEAFTASLRKIDW